MKLSKDPRFIKLKKLMSKNWEQQKRAKKEFKKNTRGLMAEMRRLNSKFYTFIKLREKEKKTK